MRTQHRPRLSVLVAILVGCSAAMAAPTQVKIVAYINQTSGCQVPTETYLKELAATYKDRVSLEFVDFGQPAGQKRWRDDGMHCLAIVLDGSTKADIVYKGAEIKVAFEMPVGHLWLHEELGTAVRQKLNGVLDTDRTAPVISVEKKEDLCDVLAGETVIIKDTEAAKGKAIADALIKATKDKGLTQDDFEVAPVTAGALVSVRGEALFEIARDNQTDDEFGREVVQTYLNLVAPFPRISRPFPGMKQPQRRR